MQIELNAYSGQPVESDNGPRNTGIGPGLWLITVKLSVGISAPAGPDPATVGLSLVGHQTATSFSVGVTADPETTATATEFLFAKLILVTVPDLQLQCISSPGIPAGGNAIICAEKIH